MNVTSEVNMSKLSLDHESASSMDLVDCESAPSPPVMDVLKFLLPGLCHLSAEDKARVVLIQETFHGLLAEYFTHQWTVYTTVNMPDNEAEVCSM